MTLNVLVSLGKMGPRGIAQVVVVIVVKVLKDPPRQRDLWPSPSTGVLILFIIIIILQVAA